MESCWWVFKQLHEKGAVYRGYKVMPYSTVLTTPLSNNEAQVIAACRLPVSPRVVFSRSQRPCPT